MSDESWNNALRQIVERLNRLIESDPGDRSINSEMPGEASESDRISTAIERADLMLRFRKFRNATFSDLAPMMTEPAWDMALHLFLATMRGQEMSVTELEELCEIPHSTAFRYKRVLIETDWIVQRHGKRDARQEMLSLSQRRVAELISFLNEAPFESRTVAGPDSSG